MMRRLPVLLLALLLSSSTVSLAAQDELLEKIDRLEQQIKQLRALKEQQKLSVLKEEQCMKAVGREKFCKCVAERLPQETSFEQYVHTLVTPKDKLGYESMSAEQKASVDAVLETREKCIEKGFFK